MYKKIVLALCFVIFGSASMAYSACGPVPSADTTNIYFVNGINTSEYQAAVAASLIAKAYGPDLATSYPNENFVVSYAYNFSISMMADILETLQQKIDEESNNDPTVTKYTAAQYLSMINTTLGDTETSPAIKLAVTEILVNKATNSVTATELIQKCQTDLQEGKRVLLIAHSQGNLFANQAVSALMGQYSSSIGLIGVASPASVTVNNSPYWTANDDRVIDGLRLTVPSVLPGNIDNDPGILGDHRDWLNHNFAKSYFDDSLASRTQIDIDFYDYINTLQYPSIQLGSGAITVTLTWGAQPDVDLHVYEPNGTHVYYSNMQGVSGYLDLDDVTSYGPEHYYVACDTLEEGIYSVGVNYFRGSGPETAHVQISTADGNTRSFDQDLSTAYGSNGNSSPISIASIAVTADGNGGYTYQVIQ